FWQQRRRAGSAGEQCRLEHDDRREPTVFDELSARERADDEEGGSGPADPAVFESRPFPRLRRAERERIGEGRGRPRRRGRDEADQQERREARWPQEANRDDRSLRLTAGECGAKRLGQVGEAPDQRAGREPDRRPGAEQEPKLLGREPALLEK